MPTYKFDYKYTDLVEDNQLSHFKNDFIDKSDSYINIEYNPRTYNVNKDNIEIPKAGVKAISFFSGAGGLDIGAQLAGVRVISSLDFDSDSVSTIKSNKYFKEAEHFQKNIKDVSVKDYDSIIKNNKPDKLILIGGPPCQPFSKAGYWVTNNKRLGSNDSRNMIGEYLRIIEELKPDGFILENVESLLHPRNHEAVKRLEEAINKLGYYYIKYKANAADFGVPQKRKRVFFIASKEKIEKFPIKTHGSEKDRRVNPNLQPYERVVDWIGQYNAPQFSDGFDSIEGKYSEDLRSVPPGQNYIALTSKRGHPEPKFIAGKRYWSFLLKLHPLLPSWTIISKPGHWEGPFHWENRRLRLKELAAIQTFPDDYNFVGSRRSIQSQIGNAVPPFLGYSMVKHLIQNL